MIYELAAILISFLALPTGYILAGMAKEELKPGKRYFILAQKVVLILLIILFIIYLLILNNLILLVNIILSIILFYLNNRFIKNPKKNKKILSIIYLLFLISSILAIKHKDLLMLHSLLVLIYSLSTGYLVAT